ncbi:hypothetical protein BGX26_007173 [Mortierella sp. AD094]|nr:hypothetical protein BGX26_007173 [Mortierella sp. AD094]
MVLSAIWTLAFGAQNPLPDLSHEDSPLSDTHENGEDQDVDQNESGNQANTEMTLKRQRDVTEAERDILGTTVYLPAPNIRDEAAENKSGFILVVTSLTLNNIGCYPFFGIRDRHQVQYSLITHDVASVWLNTSVFRDTNGANPGSSTPAGESSSSAQQGGQQQQQASNGNGPITAVTATEISATIMAAMPTVSSSSPTSTTVAVNRARRGLRYLSAVTPRNPTLLQEFYPEMVCAMTSSMITRVLLYPLDTVASRVSAQGGSFPGIGFAPTPYSGFWDCWVRSIRAEGGGISGLYSGVVDCIIIEAMVRWVVLEGTWFAHLVIKWVHRR